MASTCRECESELTEEEAQIGGGRCNRCADARVLESPGPAGDLARALLRDDALLTPEAEAEERAALEREVREVLEEGLAPLGDGERLAAGAITAETQFTPPALEAGPLAFGENVKADAVPTERLVYPQLLTSRIAAPAALVPADAILGLVDAVREVDKPGPCLASERRKREQHLLATARELAKAFLATQPKAAPQQARPRGS